jgi:hypothetical protein
MEKKTTVATKTDIKKGGTLFITTPSYSFPLSLLPPEHRSTPTASQPSYADLVKPGRSGKRRWFEFEFDCALHGTVNLSDDKKETP